MKSSLKIIDPSEVKQQTDHYLAAFFDERIHHAEVIGPSYVLLWQTAKTLVLAGGKRFRPYMVALAYQAFAPNEPIEDIMPAAIAQELIHSAMLIHDDIIDRDLVRYGVKNMAGQYNDIYRSYVEDNGERSHLSASAALLVGDALISDAYRMVHSTQASHERIHQASEIVSKGMFEVIGGELLDSEVAFMPKGSIQAETIAKHKTASYSFISPLTMGAVLAGASESDIHVLTQLSEHLGIGYQLRDDLLGMFGDEAKTGKSTTTDLREGKRTYLIEQFEKLATQPQQTDFFRHFQRAQASDAELLYAKQLLLESGAKAAVETTIDQHRSQAEVLVEQLGISDDARSAFWRLIDMCLARNS